MSLKPVGRSRPIVLQYRSRACLKVMSLSCRRYRCYCIMQDILLCERCKPVRKPQNTPSTIPPGPTIVLPHHHHQTHTHSMCRCSGDGSRLGISEEVSISAAAILGFLGLHASDSRPGPPAPRSRPVLDNPAICYIYLHISELVLPLSPHVWGGLRPSLAYLTPMHARNKRWRQE